MNIPFIPEGLLEINEKYQVTLYKDEKILVIDNWYKNFDLFCEIVNQLPLPRWKWNVNGKNFIDYYDCRPTISFGQPDKDKINYFLNHIKKLIKNNFSDDRDLTLMNQIMEFNF